MAVNQYVPIFPVPTYPIQDVLNSQQRSNKCLLGGNQKPLAMIKRTQSSEMSNLTQETKRQTSCLRTHLSSPPALPDMRREKKRVECILEMVRNGET